MDLNVTMILLGADLHTHKPGLVRLSVTSISEGSVLCGELNPYSERPTRLIGCFHAGAGHFPNGKTGSGVGNSPGSFGDFPNTSPKNEVLEWTLSSS